MPVATFTRGAALVRRMQSAAKYASKTCAQVKCNEASEPALHGHVARNRPEGSPNRNASWYGAAAAGGK